MNKEFIQLVADLLPDEKVLFCTGVEELMSKLFYEEHYLKLQFIFDDSSERSELENGDDVYQLYVGLMSIALNKIGVELSDFTITNQEILNMLTAIFSLVDEINIDVVDHVLRNADGDATAMLAEMLGHVTDREMAFWYPVLETVDDNLIAKIRATSVDVEVVNIVTDQTNEIKGTFNKVFPDISRVPAIDVINSVMVLPANKDTLLESVLEELKNENAIDKSTGILAVLILSGDINKSDIMFSLEEIVEDNFSFTNAPAVTFHVTSLIRELP